MIPKGIIWKVEYQCVVSGEHLKNKVFYLRYNVKLFHYKAVKS